MTRAAMIALVAGLAVSAQGQTTWVGNGDGSSWNDGANWGGGIEPNSSGTNVLIDGDGMSVADVTLNLSRSVGDLEITAGDSLTLLQGGNFSISGDLTNNGTLNMVALNASATALQLSFIGNSMITGNGELVLNDDSNNTINSSNATLTNGAGHTIRGAGRFLQNTGGVINNGSIIADQVNNALILDPGSQGFENNGVLRAQGGGTLTLGSGVFTNNATIDALDGSVVSVGSSAVILGGTLSTVGSGVIDARSGSDFNGVTVAGGSLVRQVQSQNAEIRDGLTNNGRWEVNSLDSSATATSLSFVGDQLIDGNGEIVFNDDSNNQLVSSNATLTNGAGHTIRGAGTLLLNSGGIINNGTILAQGDSALRIDPGSQDFVNNGVLRAEGMGGLRLGSGEYTNNTTIEAGDASKVVIESTAVVIGGDLTSTGSGLFEVLSGADLNGVTLTAGSLARQNQSQNAEIRDGLTNEGRWEVSSLDSSATATVLSFVGSQSIDGGGEIVLNDDANNAIQAANSVVTNGVNHTIRGAGNVLANSGGIINNGAILAQGDNALRLDPGGEGFVNNGVLRAEGAGGLQLGSGEYTNNTTIEAGDASKVVIQSSAVVIGGDLTSTGSGLFEVLSGADFTGVTLTAGSRAVQNQSQNTEIRDGLTNEGRWEVNSSAASATATVLTFVGTQSIDGSGEIVLNDDSNNAIQAAGSVVTNGVNHTIRGAGNVLANAGGIINNGTILAQGDNGLRFDPGGEGFVNNGVLQAEGAGGLILGSGVYTNNTAITALAGSKIRVESSAVVEGGDLTTMGDGFVEVRSGADFTGVTLTAGSRSVQNQSQNTEIRGGLTNDGRWEVNSSAASATATILSFVGTQTIDGSGEIVLNDDANNTIQATGSVITNGENHTIRGAGNLLANSGGFVNAGRLFAVGGNELVINAGVEGFVNSATGVLGGTGTFEFLDGAFTNDGVVAAGLSTGTLTWEGDFSNSSTAELAVEILSTSDFDVFSVDGSYEAGGIITVELIGGLLGIEGGSYEVVTATDGVSGNFENAIAGSDGVARGVTVGSVTFDVVYNNNSIVLTNVVPSPAAAGVFGLAGLVAARRRRG